MILKHFLEHHPEAHTAWLSKGRTAPTIEAIAYPDHEELPTTHSTSYVDYEIIWHTDEPPKPLYLPIDQIFAETPYTKCQNSPVKLGCQIQPHARNWVGTAGAPVKFLTPDGKTRYGFITNAHVSGQPITPADKQIHQPSTNKPPIATTEIFAYPQPKGINTIDVALCDSKIDDYHHTAWEVLDLGRPSPHWLDATPGKPAIKVGRTTGLTRGQCTATNAQSRIDYGSFIATFQDLDVYRATSGLFSAAGDSGSMIFHAETLEPMSLLFAGGGATTLAIPIRNIAKTIRLTFDPKEKLSQ